MDQFLIYIIVSSLVTLISIMSAYKSEDEELRFADFRSNELETNLRENAPAYSEQTLKTTTSGATSNKLRVSAH